jgi:hypothetical protein
MLANKTAEHQANLARELNAHLEKQIKNLTTQYETRIS